MNGPAPAAAVERVRQRVEEARRIVVLTGAGVSAESGVPTFRGEQGLWRSFRAEDLATPEAFARNPSLVWEWYRWRRGLVAGCRPNAAHLALARLALSGREAEIVTQNVDGLHHRAAREAAGAEDPSPAYPTEVHGALMRDRCSGCGARSEASPDVDAASAELPECQACGALLRPDVVWFGEALDPAVIARAFDAARGADLCLVVGTSALVHPAASIPLATLEAGGDVIEVNLGRTPLSPRAVETLVGPASEIVPAILG